MSASALTRCPGCSTVFRITAAQLALREGQVRCGQCRAVFDANDHLVAEEPLDVMPAAAELETSPSHVPDIEAPIATPSSHVPDAEAPTATSPSHVPDVEAPIATPPSRVPDVEAPIEAPHAERAIVERQIVDVPQTDESASDISRVEAPVVATPDKVALAEAPPVDSAGAERPSDSVAGKTAIEPTVAETPVESAAREMPVESAEAETPVEPVPAGRTETAPAAMATPLLETPGVERPARYEWKPRKPVRERPALLYVAAVVLLAVALALQLVLEYRDRLAAHAPFTQPIFASACSLLGCAIAPLHDVAALSIDASDLQADPAHRGLLQLSATIRNRAAYAIAYPYLELTLTDASDQVVARRALAPREYVGGTADQNAGIPGNGESVVRLFIDASATTQAGYRLYLFYP